VAFTSIHKIDRRTFFRELFKTTSTGISLLYAFKFYASASFFKFFYRNPFHKRNIHEFLKKIYIEVRELGSYYDDNFIKREFFINLDGYDANKEEHVVILNNREEGFEKMRVQVTYFEAERKNRIIKWAKNTREISYCLKGLNIEIEKCDYSNEEMESLLPKILDGIRDKKRLLKLLDKK